MGSLILEQMHQTLDGSFRNTAQMPYPQVMSSEELSIRQDQDGFHMWIAATWMKQVYSDQKADGVTSTNSMCIGITAAEQFRIAILVAWASDQLQSDFQWEGKRFPIDSVHGV